MLGISDWFVLDLNKNMQIFKTGAIIYQLVKQAK